MSIKKCETVKQRIAVTFLTIFHATFLATLLTTFLANCVGMRHDIATLPVFRSVPEILETQRVRSWRLKEWEPRNIPRRMCKPEA